MSIGAQTDRVNLAGVENEKVKDFKYLSSVIQDDGHAILEIYKEYKLVGKIREK